MNPRQFAMRLALSFPIGFLVQKPRLALRIEVLESILQHLGLFFKLGRIRFLFRLRAAGDRQSSQSCQQKKDSQAGDQGQLHLLQAIRALENRPRFRQVLGSPGRISQDEMEGLSRLEALRGLVTVHAFLAADQLYPVALGLQRRRENEQGEGMGWIEKHFLQGLFIG